MATGRIMNKTKKSYYNCFTDFYFQLIRKKTQTKNKNKKFDLDRKNNYNLWLKKYNLVIS